MMKSSNKLDSKIENISINDIDYSLANLKGLPISIFKANRANLVEHLLKNLNFIETNSILLLQGGKDFPRYDTDSVFNHFVQDSNLYYLSGLTEPNFFFYLDIQDPEKSLLFMTIPDQKTKTYMRVPSLEEVTKTYGITCLDLNDIYSTIAKRNPKAIYRLKGTNSDSKKNIITAEFNPPEQYKYLNDIINDDPLIYELFADRRTIKSPQEIDVLKYLVNKDVEIHTEVIKFVKPGLNERDIENKFYRTARVLYTREPAYFPICASGKHSATLHYNGNKDILQDGGLILMDMGIKLGGFNSDLTSTVPINGKFTTKQKQIYDIVLLANRNIQSVLKDGVFWPDMHILAERTILTELQKIGLLSSSYSINQMLIDRVAAYFMPHGVGHLIGLEMHDVGGYLSFTPPRSKLFGLSSLRTARYLKEGTIITVEPGIYFIEFLLNKALADDNLKKYFIADKLKEYYDFGGVRIEDNVLVNKYDCTNLSKNMPRTTEEIEAIMSKSN